MKREDKKSKGKKEQSMALSVARHVFILLFVGWVVMRLSVSKEQEVEEPEIVDLDLEAIEDGKDISNTGSGLDPPPGVNASLLVNVTSPVNASNDSDTFFNSSDMQYIWGPWSAWSECSVTCSGGVKVRSRRCYHVTWSSPRMVAFNLCEGDAIEEESCLLKHCPDDQTEKLHNQDGQWCQDGGAGEGIEADFEAAGDADTAGPDAGNGAGDGGFDDGGPCNGGQGHGAEDNQGDNGGGQKYTEESYVKDDGTYQEGHGDAADDHIQAEEAQDAQAEPGDQGQADAGDYGEADADADGDYQDGMDADGPDGGDNDGADDDGQGRGDWEEQAERDAEEGRRRMSQASMNEERRQDGEQGDQMEDDNDADDGADDRADGPEADDDFDDDDDDEEGRQKQRRNPEEEEEDEEEDKDEEDEEAKKKLKRKKRKKKKKRKRKKGSGSSSSTKSSDRDTLEGMTDVGSDVYTPGPLDSPDQERFPLFSLLPRQPQTEVRGASRDKSSEDTSSTSSFIYTSGSESSSCDTSDYEPSDISESDDNVLHDDQVVPGSRHSSTGSGSRSASRGHGTKNELTVPSLVLPKDRAKGSKHRRKLSRGRSLSLPLGLEGSTETDDVFRDSPTSPSSHKGDGTSPEIEVTKVDSIKQGDNGNHKRKPSKRGRKKSSSKIPETLLEMNESDSIQTDSKSKGNIASKSESVSKPTSDVTYHSLDAQKHIATTHVESLPDKPQCSIVRPSQIPIVKLEPASEQADMQTLDDTESTLQGECFSNACSSTTQEVPDCQ